MGRTVARRWFRRRTPTGAWAEGCGLFVQRSLRLGLVIARCPCQMSLSKPETTTNTISLDGLGAWGDSCFTSASAR